MKQRDRYEFFALATYNSEVARGIVHTPEWVEQMRAEQDRFNAIRTAEAERNGWIIVDGSGAERSPVRASTATETSGVEL